MNQHLDIQIERSSIKKAKPAQDQLGFGAHFTDHMFIMDYAEGKGWHHARIVPYQPLVIDPAAKVLHYGQAVFEGLKAYRSEDQQILLFRPQRNMQRLNRSCARLGIPPIDERFALDALKQLLAMDQDWVPSGSENALYIRPFVIATEPTLTASSSLHFQFMIIMSPVGPYYEEGLEPVKISVESIHVRAVVGGVGEAKTAANYAASLKAQIEAKEKGYSQVLWLDGVHHKYIEEVGSMNVFFKINGTVYTPALKGSILDGITRASVIELLEHWGIPVVARDISIEEIYEAGQKGTLEEAFGTGTAAVISPIGELFWQEEELVIHNGQTGELSNKLYQTITGIQNGTHPDLFDWTVKLEA